MAGALLWPFPPFFFRFAWTSADLTKSFVSVAVNLYLRYVFVSAMVSESILAKMAQKSREWKFSREKGRVLRIPRLSHEARHLVRLSYMPSLKALNQRFLRGFVAVGGNFIARCAVL